MKILSIIFGISIGVLWFSYFNQHNFISATGVTLVYIILVTIITKWFTGEFDKAEFENPTYPKGVLGYSGNDNKEK